jgi:hypothetical protein
MPTGGEVVMRPEHERIQSPSAWLEYAKLTLQLFWLLFSIAAFIVLYPHFIRLVDLGQLNKVGFLGVEVELKNVPTIRLPDPIDAAKQQLMSPQDRTKLTERFHRLADKTSGATVLWVDDKHPYQNVRERRVLQAANMTVDITQSTIDALQWLAASRYDIVITNFSRTNDLPATCSKGSAFSNAGCDLIQKIISLYSPDSPAIIVYAGDISTELPTGATGLTNTPAKLFHLILDVIDERRGAPAGPCQCDLESRR